MDSKIRTTELKHKRILSLKGYNQPLVSVILCTYNRARLVGRAIASVRAQTFRNWELIIVDDGSSDNTSQRVQPLVLADHRLLYVKHRNKGLSKCRNEGIALAVGKYAAFLDSDDEYMKTHIAKRVEFMERYPTVDVIDGGVISKGPARKQFVMDLTRPGKKIHVSKCFVGGTLFAKRSVLKKIGGFNNLVYGDDFDLMQRISKKFSVKKVNFRTYVYHCDSPSRLCDLYEKGGETAILEFRRKN